MRILKAAGLLALLLWMAYLTLEIRHVREIAVDACAFAFASAKQRTSPDPVKWNSYDCPSWVNSPFSTYPPRVVP
jgi:hypothetical protein